MVRCYRFCILNGYKIANPTILARIPHEELEALLAGYGHKPYFVEGDDPEIMHQKMAATMEQCVREIRSIRQEHAVGRRCCTAAVADDRTASPKGWTGPKKSTATKWKVFGVPTRSRYSIRRPIRKA